MKYQICYRGTSGSFPLSWKKIPENMIELVPASYIYNTIHVTDKGKLELKSVVYFKPVSRFKKEIVSFTLDKNLEFGI